MGPAAVVVMEGTAHSGGMKTLEGSGSGSGSGGGAAGGGGGGTSSPTTGRDGCVEWRTFLEGD